MLYCALLRSVGDTVLLIASSADPFGSFTASLWAYTVDCFHFIYGCASLNTVKPG